MLLLIMAKNPQIRHLRHKQNVKKLEEMKMAKRNTVEIFAYTNKQGEETKFKFQHPGLLESIRMRDRSKNESGNGYNEENLYSELLEHVIFLEDGSRVNFEYFEENEGFTDVIKAATKFVFRQ